MSGGNVPKLRFPGFVGAWRKLRLDAATSKIQDGTHFSPNVQDSGKYKYVTSKNIRNGGLDLSDIGYLDEASHREIYKRCDVKFGDILLTKDGSNTGNACLNTLTEEFSLLSSVAFLRASQEVCVGEFLFQIISSDRGQKEIFKSIAGQAITRITLEKLRGYQFSFPTLPEQKKIAAFFGVVDAKIAALRARVLGLQTYKRGLMQALFSQTLRFTKPDGTAFPDWEEKRLEEVLHEHKAKSTGKEQVYSVSVHKGLVNQIEHLGRSFSAASTDHYNRVKPHDIVYTKSPTGDFPLGIIKQSLVDKDVIVSPLYGVFTPETPALGFLLHVYFESNVNVSNYLAPIVQKGAKNTINVTNAGFLSNSLVLPVSHDEQAKIAEALSAMDAKIAAVQGQVNRMQDFKKGLLQQMFV